MFSKFRRSAPVFAAGFPSTDVVTSKRLRLSGDFIRGRGAIVLSNGTNAFVVQIDRYSFVTVSSEACSDGAYELRAGLAGDGSGDLVTLARFGSHQAAKNAYSGVMKSYAGLASAESSWLPKAIKTSAAVLALFAVAVVIGLASPVADVSAAQDKPLSSHQTPAAREPGSAAFNPSEANLDDIVAGKYEFNPKLKAPDVQMPTLSCAP